MADAKIQIIPGPILLALLYMHDYCGVFDPLLFKLSIIVDALYTTNGNCTQPFKITWGYKNYATRMATFQYVIYGQKPVQVP